MSTVTPEKLSSNELLQKHGPTGSLLLTLQRYALLGWGLALFMVFAFVLAVLASTLSRKPIIVVNEQGQLIGQVDITNSIHRKDDEIVASAKFFARNYLNINSATVFDDYAQAINLMGPAFRDRTLKAVREDGYLAKIKDGNTTSRITWAEKDAIGFQRHSNDRADVQLRGHILIAGSPNKSVPFNVVVSLTVVPRSTLNTYGVVVTGVKDA